jgi:hypothetical protein
MGFFRQTSIETFIGPDDAIDFAIAVKQHILQRHRLSAFVRKSKAHADFFPVGARFKVKFGLV